LTAVTPIFARKTCECGKIISLAEQGTTRSVRSYETHSKEKEGTLFFYFASCK